MVKQVTSLVEGYISLAAIAVPEKATQMPLPAHWRRAHKDFDLVPVVSKELTVDPSCRYEEITYTSSFGDTMTFVGGINKPKLVGNPLLRSVCELPSAQDDPARDHLI